MQKNTTTRNKKQRKYISEDNFELQNTSVILASGMAAMSEKIAKLMAPPAGLQEN